MTGRQVPAACGRAAHRGERLRRIGSRASPAALRTPSGILCALTPHPAEARNERDIWIMQLLYHTGIRREECAFGVRGDFRKREDEWALRVIGKGEKERFVTVNSTLLDALIRHRRNRGLPPMPSPGDSDPIVRAVARGNAIPLTPRQIGKILERIAKQSSLDCEDGHMREQLVAMSTHWLRHTNATHRLMAGASLETTQDELGHGDPRTTRIYAQTLDAARREDAEKLSKLS